MQYAQTVAANAEDSVFVQSARADDLQNQINNAIIGRAGNARPNVSGLELGGAGDGHTFVVALKFVATSVVSSLTNATARVRVYQAADVLELPRSRTFATQGLTTENKVDEPLAGATQGTKFTGIVVLGNRQEGPA